jgi:hypothetical protein
MLHSNVQLLSCKPRSNVRSSLLLKLISSQQFGQQGGKGDALLGISLMYMGLSFLPPYFHSGTRMLKRPPYLSFVSSDALSSGELARNFIELNQMVSILYLLAQFYEPDVGSGSNPTHSRCPGHVLFPRQGHTDRRPPRNHVFC